MTTQTAGLVQINGVSLDVRERGAGEPVLFVHGAMGDECAAVVTQPALTERYRVIDYHRRGWGRSQSLEAPLSIEQQAADAVGILRHFGIERAHFVGLSYGGIILLQIALSSPEMVQTLALFEPGLPAVLATSARWGQVAEKAGGHYVAGNRAAAMENLGKEVIGDNFRAGLDKVLPEGYFERWAACSDTLFQFDSPALAAWTFTAEDAQRITQPVLNVTGAETRSYFRQIYETIADWIPHAENDVLPSASHAMFQTNPQGSAERIAAFIAKHPIG